MRQTSRMNISLNWFHYLLIPNLQIFYKMFLTPHESFLCIVHVRVFRIESQSFLFSLCYYSTRHAQSSDCCVTWISLAACHVCCSRVLPPCTLTRLFAALLAPPCPPGACSLYCCLDFQRDCGSCCCGPVWASWGVSSVPGEH